VRENGVVPLPFVSLSAGLTVIAIPLDGFEEFTVSVYVVLADGVKVTGNHTDLASLVI
jgi:hypothetical protein